MLSGRPRDDARNQKILAIKEHTAALTNHTIYVLDETGRCITQPSEYLKLNQQGLYPFWTLLLSLANLKPSCYQVQYNSVSLPLCLFKVLSDGRHLTWVLIQNEKWADGAALLRKYAMAQEQEREHLAKLVTALPDVTSMIETAQFLIELCAMLSWAQQGAEPAPLVTADDFITRQFGAQKPSECAIFFHVQTPDNIPDLVKSKLIATLIDSITKMNISAAFVDFADIAVELKDGGSVKQAVKLAAAIKKHCDRFFCVATADQNSVALKGELHGCIVRYNDQMTPGTLVQSVQIALTVAIKENKTPIWDLSMTMKCLKDQAINESLVSALDNNMAGFSLQYQPIADFRSGQWSGLEALCRWHSPEFGPVKAAKLIAQAKSIGIITRIDMWVIEEAVKQMKYWQFDELDPFILNINISDMDSIHNHLDEIAGILKKYAYPPSKVSFEIFDSVFLFSTPQKTAAFKRLKEHGLALTIVNFGSQSIALNALYTASVKLLKCNSKTVLDYAKSPQRQRLFAAMVDVARSLGIRIVCEYVETREQAALLLKQDFTFMQGRYFSTPLTVDELNYRRTNFYKPMTSLLTLHYQKLDLIKNGAFDNDFPPNPALSKLLMRCLQALFHNTDMALSLEYAMKEIGEVLHVSRSYVFERQSPGGYAIIHEWCANGIAPISGRQEELSPFCTTIIPKLVEDGLIVANDTSALQDDTIILMPDVKSIAVFPLWQSRELYGFIGFDVCDDGHNWTGDALQMLYALSNITASVLGRISLQKRVYEQAEVMENILNSMDIIIYVVDRKNCKILFANNEAQQVFGSSLKGQICYQAIRNRDEKCENCAIDAGLLETLGVSEWEFYNEKNGQYYKMHNSIVKWSGGKTAYLDYADDITNVKTYQKKLEFNASMDKLTSVLNRASFLRKLKRILDEKDITTLVFIDVDKLKKTNDTLGHSYGDVLIQEVAEALKSSIRSSDILGRYGGDEFIIAMVGCTDEQADLKMQSAQRTLKKQAAEKHLPFITTFSYGLVQSDAIPYSTDSGYVDQLIHIADQRMFEQKKEKRG